MGLDMYLSARQSFYANDALSHGIERERNEAIRSLFVELNDFKTGNLDYVTVEIEAGYWRKANEIHAWFVANAQDGEDNCGNYYVGRDKLKELKKLCEDVLNDNSKASELLPTQSGFFFGSTEYDQYYFDDLKHTIEIINRCLALPDNWSFSYHSSW